MAKHEVPQPLQPKGPVQHDLRSLPSDKFEQLCFRLIRLDFPKAIKPSDVRDGGADALLPAEGGGYARAWQSKHFPGAIDWSKCKKSLEDARRNVEMEHYTFCFPRNLTDRERTTFDKHFRQPSLGVEVDYWNGEELQIRLTESTEGERVAKAFFATPQTDMSAVTRAIEAGGPLETTEDALDRLSPIGEFLAAEDPFFSYSAVVHETDQPGPAPADEAVMSVIQSESGLTQRIDVVPRDDQALALYGPELQLLFPDTEAGRASRKEFLEALKAGRGAKLDEVTVNFTRLPPGMKSSEGLPTLGSVEVSPSTAPRPRPPAPWKAHMVARTDKGREQINVDLLPSSEPPPDWDGMLEGEFGGMQIRMLFRRTERGGEMTLNYTHKLDASPIRDQLRALRFLNTLTGEGELLVKDREGGRDDLVLKTQPESESDEARAVFALLENLSVIEDWAGEHFVIPKEVTAQETQSIARVAAAIRQKGMPVRFKSVEMSVDGEGLLRLREGGQIGVARELGAKILGRDVRLGNTWLSFTGYKLTELGPDPDAPNATLVRIEPEDGESGDLFQTLEKTPIANRPPAPPRRKKRRTQSRRKRGRGKRRGR